jgi:hypothetical protein
MSQNEVQFESTALRYYIYNQGRPTCGPETFLFVPKLNLENHRNFDHFPSVFDRLQPKLLEKS